LAGGEGCHDFHQARNMIDYAGIGFIQIDAGRIGGLTTAKQVADYAQARGVKYVNHTFTSSLALSASLQPYAGLENHSLCELPCAPSSLAQELTTARLLPNTDGCVEIPEAPGLGLEINPAALRKYDVPVEIRVRGKTLFSSARVLE
jgi:L-alanine-DL-glutamate epimerase-like enolase superfamily enzyme